MMATTNFISFSHDGKFSKVRWARQQAFRVGELNFATGTYDEPQNKISLWRCSISQPQNTAPNAPPSSEDTEYQVRIAQSLPHHGQVVDLSFTDDGQYLVSASSLGGIGMYAMSGREQGGLKEIGTVQAHSFGPNAPASCNGLAVQPNVADPEIASVGEDGKIAFVRLANGSLSDKHTPQERLALTGITWRSSTQLVTSSEGGRISIFDRRRRDDPGMTFADSSERPVPLSCVAVHPTQNVKIATGNRNGDIQVWDIRNTSAPESKLFRVHSSDVWELRFHPNNPNQIVSCSEDASVCVLNWNQQQPANDSHFHRSRAQQKPFKKIESLLQKLSVNSLDIHPDNNILIAAGDAAEITLSTIR
ncbi:Nucleoporin Nup43 [Quaeritorhiza haematococci]|nr:Nucleoporin Nup43 [Quaeritorhiza haematococci]